jgi:hypothetical protein
VSEQRRQVEREADKELVFIGMKPQVRVDVLTQGHPSRCKLQRVWVMKHEGLGDSDMHQAVILHVTFELPWRPRVWVGVGCLSSVARSSGRLTKSWST